MQFHAEPAVGILEAGAAADIALVFSPDSQHRYIATASCAVHRKLHHSNLCCIRTGLLVTTSMRLSASERLFTLVIIFRAAWPTKHSNCELERLNCEINEAVDVLMKSHGSQSACGLMCRFLSWAQLLVDTSVPGSSSIPKYSKRVLEVALEGIGAACSVLVWPPTIRRPAALELGQVSLLISKKL